MYGKDGCHLCENVVAELRKLNSAHEMQIIAEDITKDPTLYERYHDAIPVVAVDGKIKLAGAVLSDPRILSGVLRKAINQTLQ